MMTRATLAALALLAVSCSCDNRQEGKVRCIGIDQKVAREFIIECAKAANPMSDEEGEDLVHECGLQAR